MIKISVMVSNFTVDDDDGDLPSDMRFNSAHIISIVGYSSLFVVSSIANLVRSFDQTRKTNGWVGASKAFSSGQLGAKQKL